MDDIETQVQEIQEVAQKWMGITLRDHQLVWLRFILTTGEICHLESPRRHGKSTVLRAYMLWSIIKDPEIRILIASNKERLTSTNIRYIQRIIEANRNEFMSLYNIEPGKPWRATEMSLGGEVFNSDPTMMGAATGSRVTGASSDLIVMDDTITKDHLSTPEQYDKLIEWIHGELYNTQDPWKAKTIVIGTRKSTIDWYNELIDNPDIPCHIDRAIMTDENGDEYALWPREGDFEGRGFTMESLYKRRRAKPALFAREWMNTPNLPDGYRFKRSDLKFFEQPPHDDFLTKWIGIDPAFGREKRSSQTAFCVVAHDRRHDHIYILEMFKDRLSLIQQIDKAQELYMKYEPEGVIYESEMMFGVMYEEFARAVPRAQDLKWPDKMSKELRIESTLSPLFRDGKLFFRNPSNDHFTSLFIEEELIPFGGSMGIKSQQNKSPTDMLDSLCVSISQISIGGGGDSIPIRAVRARTW